MPSVHPEFEYQEHRKLSFEDGGLAEFADATSSMDLVDCVVVPVVHRLSDHAVMYRQQLNDVDGNTSSMLVLVTWLDGLVRIYEVFDVDDIDAAITRYDELDAER